MLVNARFPTWPIIPLCYQLGIIGEGGDTLSRSRCPTVGGLHNRGVSLFIPM